MEDRKINVVDITDRIKKRENTQLAKDMAEQLDMDLESMREIVCASFGEVSLDEIGSALSDAMERGMMYEAYCEAKAKREEAEGRDPQECHNMVCSSYEQSEGEIEVDEEDENGNPTGMSYIEQTGRKNFCSKSKAQDCLYRMTESPPSNISHNVDSLPSHAECVKMLSRSGMLPGDDFGHYNGTDFAFSENTKKLWFAFAELVGKTCNLDFDEPVEKSNAIAITKYYFLSRMGMMDGPETEMLENDIANDLRYLVNMSGGTVTEGEETTFEFVYDNILNRIIGLNLGSKAKE